MRKSISFLLLLISFLLIGCTDSIELITIQTFSAGSCTTEQIPLGTEYKVPEIDNPGYELVSIIGNDGKNYTAGEKIYPKNNLILTYEWSKIIAPIEITLLSDSKEEVFEVNEGSTFTVPFKYRNGYKLIYVSSSDGGEYQPGESFTVTNSVILTYEWKYDESNGSDFIYESSNGVVTIKKYVGEGRHIVIPSEINGEPVRNLAKGAFDGVEASFLEIPDTVERIEDLNVMKEFSFDDKLSIIDIPESVSYVGEYAFGRGFLINVKGDTSSWAPSWNMLGKIQNTEIMNPYVIYGAFMDSDGLIWSDEIDGMVLVGYTGNETSLVIPDMVKGKTVTGLRCCASSAYTVKEIHFPVGLSSVEVDFSDYFSSLRTMTIDSKNKKYACIDNCLIDKDARKLIYATPEGVIPSDGSVKTIGKSAFSRYDTTDVYIPDGVEVLEGGALGDLDLQSLYFGKDLISIEDTFWTLFSIWGGYKYDKITVSPQNPNFRVVDDCLVDREGRILKVSKRGTLPEDPSVTILGSFAFSNFFDSYYHLVLPNNITTVEKDAFLRSGFASVRVPASVISVQEGGFSNFYASDIFIEADISTWEPGWNINIGAVPVFSNPIAESYTWIEENGAAVITCYLGEEKNVTVPAFLGGLPVKAIGSLAFKNSIIETLVIPEGIERIYGSAFNKNKNLHCVSLPASLESISPNSFSECDALSTITIDEGNTVYHSDGNCVIHTESKTLILGCQNSVIPSDGSVTSIGKKAFYYITNLKSINIPTSVKMIEEDAFSGCLNLKNIVLNEGLEVIDDRSFYGCMSLESMKLFSSSYVDFSMVLPSSLRRIGKHAFEGCSGITSACLGGNDLVLDEGAFLNTDLKKVDLCNTIKIGKNAFVNSALLEIYIPACVKKISPSAFNNCKKLVRLNVDEANENYWSLDNMLLRRSDCFIVKGFGGTPIPADTRIMGIDEYAFVDVQFESDIIIPDSVSYIGAHAFANIGSANKTIFIPASVAYVGEDAFAWISYWTIEIEGDTSEWSPLWDNNTRAKIKYGKSTSDFTDVYMK